MSSSNPSTETTASLGVSFIIPTLNEATLLQKLLASIRELELPSNTRLHEIIVVDAASTDKTPEIASENGCVLINTQPGKVALSRNKGAAHATGNVLAFVDADTELPATWLACLVQELTQERVVAAGATMALSPRATSWVEKTWHALAHKRHTSDFSQSVKWLATFNLLVEKTTFDEIGGFDTSLITCEDVEFSYRLAEFGILRRVNQCGVIHHGESQTVREFFQREAWRARGSIGTIRKHWRSPRELASFIMPFAVVSGQLFGLSLVALSLFCSEGLFASIEIVAGIAFTTAILPVVLLAIRKRVTLAELPHCVVLLCIYYFARLNGTLLTFKRVERSI